MDDKRLQIILAAVDETKQSFKSVTDGLAQLQASAKKVNETTSATSSLTSGIKALAAAAGGLAVFGTITSFLQSTIQSFSDAEKVGAQLTAVIKSTGGAAGVTVDAALALSKSLEATTTFGDEAVLTAENMILTFTNIKNNIFPQVTSTALDMSVALGQDVSSSAMQLGKALNDPVQGMNALRRVGVAFTDDQERMVKQLVKSGDTLTAQKLILAELNKEFGGSAAAQADTYAGKLMQIKERFDDMKETIGAKLLPVVVQLFTYFEQAAPTAIDAMEKTGNSIVSVIGFVHDNIDVVKDLIAMWVGYRTAVLVASGITALTASFDTILMYMGLMRGGFLLLTVSANVFWGAVTGGAALAAMAIYNAFRQLDSVNASVSASAKAANDSAQALANAYNKKNGTNLGAMDFGGVKETTTSSWLGLKETKSVETATVDMTKLREATALLHPEIAQAKTALQTLKLPPLNPDPAKAKEMETALKELAKEYKDLQKTGSDQLFELDQNHKKTLEGLSEDITKVRDNMKGLRDDYVKTANAAAIDLSSKQKDNTTNVAEAVVKNEQRIAEIKNQLSGSVAAKERVTLQAELDARTLAISQNAQFLQSIDASVVEARRVAGLSELQKAIEDFNTKQTLAQAEYDSKIALANAELAEKMAREKKEMEALNIKVAQENALYDQKKKFIIQTLADTQKAHDEAMKNSLLTTKTAIDKEIEAYKQLAEAIKAARSGDVATVNRAQASVKSINDGVVGPSGNIITTNPADFLIATTNPAGLANDISAAKNNGPTVVYNINFDGATFMGKEGIARDIGKTIIDELKLNQRLA